MGLQSNHVFIGFTLISALLIWGVSVRNGLITLCGDAAEAQKLPDGTPLRTKYTGILPIDFITTTQVIFFHEIVRRDPWILINGFSLAFAIMVCQMVEGVRRGFRGKRSVESAGTWTVAGQHLGVGMLNPVYYSYHAKHSAAGDTQMDGNGFSIPVSQAAAILPSVVLGGVYPCYLLITRANTLDTDTYQQFLAALQPFGLFVSAFQLLFSTLLRYLPLGRGAGSKSRNAELPYLRILYALTILFATLLHNYARFLHTVPDTGATAFSWNSLYVPSFAPVSQLSDVVIVFMRNDILVLGLGAVLWAGWLLGAEGKMGTISVALLGLLGYGILGPGATCVGGMWIREEMSRNEGGLRSAKIRKSL